MKLEVMKLCGKVCVSFLQVFYSFSYWVWNKRSCRNEHFILKEKNWTESKLTPTLLVHSLVFGMKSSFQIIYTFRLHGADITIPVKLQDIQHLHTQTLYLGQPIFKR